ncbi:sucrose transport protein SUT3 isoform X2 [Triticum aestivum]|nr:sucrose transport protein SUT3-like isoform X2 [Triticum aestivum]
MVDHMELSVESGGGGRPPPTPQISLVGLFLACMVAGGVQYGWALQLSLLTPYVQTLGIPHALTSVMWLCGPIAGLIVQPCVGLSSDKCGSPLGRQRPFILSGCIVISISVIIVGFSSDIGYALGDTKEDCKDYTGPRYRAAAAFILGFWLLDFSNNTVQDEWKCSYLEWVDQEWPQSLKMCLAKLWITYEEENKDRLRESVLNTEEYFKMWQKKSKMENELRCFKLDFAKMVLAKEEALSR